MAASFSVKLVGGLGRNTWYAEELRDRLLGLRPMTANDSNQKRLRISPLGFACLRDKRKCVRPQPCAGNGVPYDSVHHPAIRLVPHGLIILGSLTACFNMNMALRLNGPCGRFQPQAKPEYPVQQVLQNQGNPMSKDHSFIR